MKNCLAYLGQQPLGTATFRQEGPRLQVTVTCPLEEGWFYRAVLTDGQTEWPLGLLAPEGQTLRRDKWLTASQTAALERAADVRCILTRTRMDGREEAPPEPPPPPKLVQPPGVPLEDFTPDPPPLQDGLLARLADKRGDCRWTQNWLLAPVRAGEDPLAPFYCLMAPASCGADRFFLLALEEGRPARLRQDLPSPCGIMDPVIT